MPGEPAAVDRESRPFPDASDFSPAIISSGDKPALRRLLRIVKDGAGHRPTIVESIRAAFFAERAPSQALKSASNPLIALNDRNYRLLRPDVLELNDIGEQIRSAPTEDDALEQFARHIVRDVTGGDLLRAVGSIQARGHRPNKETLAFELGLLGYTIGPTHTDATRMAQWLRAARVLDGWTVIPVRLNDVAGISFDDLEEWADLDEPQRAVLRSLRRHSLTSGDEPVDIEILRDEVRAIHGDAIWRRPDHIAEDVIYALADRQWLVRPQREGRGARMGTTRALPRLLDVDVDVLDRQMLSGLPAQVRAGLNRPVAELLDDLDTSDSVDAAGRALEILTARIAVEVGLTGLILRDRSERTGGIEVDLTGEFVGRTYSRWVIQCKNTTGKAGPEVLSREVGVAVVTQATVVVLVSRGGFSDRLESLAAQVNRRTPLQVMLLGGSAIDRYRDVGVRAITAELQRQAVRIAETKREGPTAI